MTICRKIKLFPVGDKEEINRVYDFIRNGQYAQYQACNILRMKNLRQDRKK